MEKVTVKPGVYRHNKGYLYRVLAVARSVKDNEPRVIFHEMYDDYQTWILPLNEWTRRFNHVEPVDLDNIIDKVGLLLVKDGEILMAKKRGEDVFKIPGGYRQDNETDLQCLVREIKQELGVNINVASAQHYGTFVSQAHAKPPGFLVQVICYLATHEGILRASSAEKELVWMRYHHRDMVATAAKIIFDELFYKGLLKE